MATCFVPRKDICVYRNSRYGALIKTRSKDGEDVDFSEYEFLMHVRKSRDSQTIIAEYSNEGNSPEFTVPQGKVNQFRFFLNSAKTKELTAGEYVYDIFIYEENAIEDKRVILRGVFEVVNSVTRF